MKAIASNIFDFTTWYKFGEKFIRPEMIIDLSDLEQSDEVLIQRTGYFEEEYELFFLEIPENSFDKSKTGVSLVFHDILTIAPLTEAGGAILKVKFPNFIIDKAIHHSLANRIINERNKQLAILGGERLRTVFDIEKSERIIQYQNAFLPGLINYLTDLNSKQISVLENLLYYERSKPYPVIDVGYFYDLGSIARSRFHVSDDEFKSKELLKEVDPTKYSIINEVLSLSRFIQMKHVEGVWDEFLKSFKSTAGLKDLNNSLKLIDDETNLNNLLVITLYLKFRDQIRNTSDLNEQKFILSIKHFLKIIPEESSVALVLVGMFFGGIKFRDLYYNQLPTIVSQVDLYDTQKILISKVVVKNDKAYITASTNIPQNPIPESNEVIFDEANWINLNTQFSTLSVARLKIIKNNYFKLISSSSKLFPIPVEKFIELIRNEMGKTKSTKKDPKTANEVIEAIEKYFDDYK